MISGIAGYISNCLVLNCWSRANVTSIKNSGGVVGHAQYSTIENCAVNNSSYSIKTTTSSTTDVAIGGVVGRITSSKVLNCYNDLNVSPAVATDYSGRVVGRVANNDTVNNLISYCYYRSNITGERNVGSNATYATVNNIYPYK